MNQDEIIQMAIEAEFVSHGKPSDEESELFVCVDKDIYKFAKLVAAKAIAQLESQEPVGHWSDCAVHSEPAYPKGECDCGGYTPPPQRTEQEPVGRFAKFTDGIWREVTDGSAGIPLYKNKK